MAQENESPQSVTGLDLGSMIGQQRDTPDSRLNDTIMSEVLLQLEEESAEADQKNA